MTIVRHRLVEFIRDPEWTSKALPSRSDVFKVALELADELENALRHVAFLESLLASKTLEG